MCYSGIKNPSPNRKRDVRHLNKDLLEYLEKVNAQEEQILRHEKPVLSYFVKGENSTVFDSGTVMAP